MIVVPSSIFDNWRKELELWCPSLKVSDFSHQFILLKKPLSLCIPSDHPVFSCPSLSLSFALVVPSAHPSCPPLILPSTCTYSPIRSLSHPLIIPSTHSPIHLLFHPLILPSTHSPVNQLSPVHHCSPSSFLPLMKKCLCLDLWLRSCLTRETKTSGRRYAMKLWTKTPWRITTF